MRHSSDEPFASAYEDDHPIPPILSLSDELSEEIAFDHHIPPILRLPDELLDKVAFHLLATPSYAEDLISLTRVCRRLSAAAVRTLFWDPTLPLYRGKIEEEADERNWERFAALVRRLEEEPSLGAHARTFHHLGQVTYFKTMSQMKWLREWDRPVIALLEACPNITEIQIAPFFGRAHVGDRFGWLDRLHECRCLEDIKLRQVQAGTGGFLMPFLSMVKLPPAARLTVLGLKTPFADLLWRKPVTISTKHLTFEDCEITDTEGWSTLPLAAPNLEHLRLQLGTLPDSLPLGLLPSTLRTLDIEIGFIERDNEDAERNAAAKSWVRHPSPLIESLPFLPNLIRLHFDSACLTTDVLFTLADKAPRLEKLLLPRTMYQDEKVIPVLGGDADTALLEVVSSFHHLTRVDLGLVPLLADEEDELACLKEHCSLNRIELAYKRDDYDESDWMSEEGTDWESESE